MTDFYSTLVDRALNKIYGEDLGPEQPKDTTIGGLGGRPMSELEGTTTAADAAEPEMPVATDAVLNAVNKMKDYTTKPLANITYVPLKAASKEAALRRNTMLDLLLAGEEEGTLPDGFAKMYDYGEVEFSALEYLDRLKSDYDRKTKATIDVPMQDKRVMDTVDPQFPMPTSTREPQYVSLEDAPDADIVLDEPIQIKTERLGSRPVAAEESSALMIPSNIDMSFLGEKEGFKLDAYIPEDKDGKVIDQSGVTVGTGVDLGSKNEEYFKDLEPSILNKLKPHFGKKREAAQKSLEENPFSLTEEEALVLDNFVKAKEFNVLKKRWDKDSEISWDDLTTNQATAIASVYYQHGNQTFGYNFWDQTTSGDWDSAYENLMTWGGSTPSRRRDEAALLKATN